MMLVHRQSLAVVATVVMAVAEDIASQRENMFALETAGMVETAEILVQLVAD